MAALLKFLPWLIKALSYIGFAWIFTDRMKAKAGLKDADTALEIIEDVKDVKKEHDKTVSDLSDDDLSDKLRRARDRK